MADFNDLTPSANAYSGDLLILNQVYEVFKKISVLFLR